MRKKNDSFYLKDFLQHEIFHGKPFNSFQLRKACAINPPSDAIFLIRSYIVWSNLNIYKYLRLLNKKKLFEKYNIDLHKNTTIDIGLKLPHPIGIVFGAGVIIGKNATIYQHGTFGVKNNDDAAKGKHPRIKDNCVFGAGSIILGPIIVSDGTIVGANAVLCKDTEPHSVYAGIPAKKILK
jgi:serine O-acetyltransferase